MPGQYKYRWDLIAQTTQFEQSMVRAADRAKKLSENTQKATGDIAKLSEGAGAGGSAVSKMGDETGKMGDKVSSVMGTLGGAMGGVKGEVVSLIGELTAVTGPIALIAAGIGGIALAWKISEENVKSYLERVEKGRMDPAIFSRSSTTALKDTKGAAQGGIDEGIRLQEDASWKLAKFGFQYTEEQKKQLELQKKLGEEMVKDNTIMLTSLGYDVMGLNSKKDRLSWIQKYNALQRDIDNQEKEEIKNKTEINGLESDLTQIRTKIFQAGDEKEKEKLLLDYDKKAIEIKDKTLTLLDKEKLIKSQMLTMTGKTEELELLGLQTDQDKATALRAYSVDMFNMQRLINKVAKTGDVVTQKELNNQSSAGYKLGAAGTYLGEGKFAQERAGFANTGQALKSSALFIHNLATPEGINNLRKYNALTKVEIDGIVKTNAELERQGEIADGLTNVFMDMFSSIDGGFEAMAKSLIHSIEQIAAELAAKAVVFEIMNILFPGSGIAAGGLMSFLGLSGLKIPGHADGGLAYGPSIGMIGEYPGAKSNPEVIAPLSKLKDMLKTSGGGGTVTFKIGNRELVGVLEQESRVSRNIRGR